MQKLKLKMLEHNETISSMATLLGVNRDTLSRWMRNDNSAMKLKKVRAISEQLNLSDEEIVAIFFKKSGEQD